MKISIFTPTHKPDLLSRAYLSLKEQTHLDWEWVIVLNSGAELEPFKDKRVKICRYEEGSNCVGALKKYACSQATGEVVLELDHDDILVYNCLEEVNKAFLDPTIDFVYSDCAAVNADWTSRTYNEVFGWQYEPFVYKGHELLSIIAPDPYPQCMSRIWFAPDHVRAWRREFYHKIGGHNETMVIADDHELILRTYLNGKMYHINKCLYIYWVSGDNTWLKYQDDIDRVQWENYNKYVVPIAEKWAMTNDLKVVNLGSDGSGNYITLNKRNADIVCNLNETWDLPDNSVGVLRANDTLANITEPIHTMNEAYRVLAHGGFFFIDVPSTDGKGAFCDPNHKSYWNDRSFKYYTEAAMRQFIEPDCNCKFMATKIENIKLYDDIPYVRAHLIALKDDSIRLHGHYQW